VGGHGDPGGGVLSQDSGGVHFTQTHHKDGAAPRTPPASGTRTMQTAARQSAMLRDAASARQGLAEAIVDEREASVAPSSFGRAR
jgi:hypothetical protein